MNTVSSHCLVHASCASIRSLWMASVTMGFARLNACVVSYCVTARAPTPLGPDRLPSDLPSPHSPQPPSLSLQLFLRSVHLHTVLLTSHSERLLCCRLQGRHRHPFPCQAPRDPAGLTRRFPCSSPQQVCVSSSGTSGPSLQVCLEIYH